MRKVVWVYVLGLVLVFSGVTLEKALARPLRPPANSSVTILMDVDFRQAYFSQGLPTLFWGGTFELFLTERRNGNIVFQSTLSSDDFPSYFIYWFAPPQLNPAPIAGIDPNGRIFAGMPTGLPVLLLTYIAGNSPFSPNFYEIAPLGQDPSDPSVFSNHWGETCIMDQVAFQFNLFNRRRGTFQIVIDLTAPSGDICALGISGSDEPRGFQFPDSDYPSMD